jgi:hypothetical protein
LDIHERDPDLKQYRSLAWIVLGHEDGSDWEVTRRLDPLEVDKRSAEFVRGAEGAVVGLLDAARAVVVDDQAAFDVDFVGVLGGLPHLRRGGEETQRRWPAHLTGSMDALLSRFGRRRSHASWSCPTHMATSFPGTSSAKGSSSEVRRRASLTAACPRKHASAMGLGALCPLVGAKSA